MGRITFICILLLFEFICAFGQEGRIQVKPQGSRDWGYANEKGELVIPAKFERCYPFSEGWATILDDNGKYHCFIDRNGNKMKTEIGDFRVRDDAKFGIFGGFVMGGFVEGRVAVCQERKWGYLNQSGKLVVPCKYDQALDFYNGHALVRINKDWYILALDGSQRRIDFQEKAYVMHFSEGFAPFYIDGLWGLVDDRGVIIKKEQFLSLGFFSNKLAYAKTKDDWVGYLNTFGEWAIKPKYYAGKDFDPVSGLARVKSKLGWRYINQEGEEFIMKDSDLFTDFSDGLAVGRKNNKKGYFNPEMEWSIEPQFEDAKDFKNGFASVMVKGKWGLINKKGEWVIEPKYDGLHQMSILPTED